MNQKMRALLAKMEERRKGAAALLEAGETEKAAAQLDEMDALKKDYELEKRMYEAAKGIVPDDIEEPATEKKASGFEAIAKMLKKQGLSETEKALISGGENGENYLVPEDVDATIRELRKNYRSAKDLVTIIPTDALAGSFNFEEGEAAGLTEFSDGSDVPGGDPKFKQKSFAIKLWGKLIAISRVIAGAEKAGLMAYLDRWFVKNAVVSENKKIFAALKKDKTAEALTSWEDLKTKINTKLDPDARIGAVIVTNQTGFDILDSALDGMGRPLLQPDPTNATNMLFSGLPVTVFSDAQLPNEAEKAPLFCGNLAAGCYFIEKIGLDFEVSEHFLFGKNQNALRVIEGFDVLQADASAYFYATLAPAGA